jgi:hypothetical protein
MERAAQLRAQGRGWPDVAETIGLSVETVKGYPSKYPPFEELVDYYADQIWRAELDELVPESQLKAIEVMSEVLEDDDADPADLVAAARTILKSTGFEKGAKTREKLKAQEAVTGEPGDRVNLKHAIGDKEDMDADELSQAYRQVVGESPSED